MKQYRRNGNIWVDSGHWRAAKKIHVRRPDDSRPACNTATPWGCTDLERQDIVVSEYDLCKKCAKLNLVEECTNDS